MATLNAKEQRYIRSICSTVEFQTLPPENYGTLKMQCTHPLKGVVHPKVAAL